ncbi:phosphoglycerol transferase [Candidatus Saccharibacteria bacterium]|nr:MAG: phosphoglycerol transferase [Candidatus Saccharibacteria bacterium]
MKYRRVMRLVARVVMYSLLAISVVVFVAARYKTTYFSDNKLDEMLFYLTNGLSQGNTTSFAALQQNFLLAGVIFVLLLLPIVDISRGRFKLHIPLPRQRRIWLSPAHVPLKYKALYCVSIFVIAIGHGVHAFGIREYLQLQNETSQLFEQHYVEPSSVTLTFPAKKRNLIYIYLESVENTVASRDVGGRFDKSRIPELEALALDPANVNFTNGPQGKLGGALPAAGTTWTVAAMSAQAGGVPLKQNLIGGDGNSMGEKFDEFLPGSYMLSDILASQGYNQSFVMGSRASFGGRDKMLAQHGDYRVIDLPYAHENGLLDPSYDVWWGYEDKKMFEYARAEATRLATLEQPFNLQLLTADTHFTDGYLDETCPTPYAAQYDNVHACSSAQINRFIDWVRSQPFADDTAIIISGDHLGMQTDYYRALIGDDDYTRTIYNVFINPSAKPSKRSERLFSSFDMYPTTLAALGVAIDGERLALGTNLFSTEPTLLEKFGNLDDLNAELSRRSVYYEKGILTRASE